MHHCRQFNMYSDNNFLGMLCKFVFVNFVGNPLFLWSINIELFAKHDQIVRSPASPLNTVNLNSNLYSLSLYTFTVLGWIGTGSFIYPGHIDMSNRRV